MANDQTKTPKSAAVEAFEQFCEAFLQKQSYVLTNKIENLFTEKNVTATYEKFYVNSKNKDNKDKKFDDVILTIISQIKDIENKENIIDIINHAVWLWALPNSRKTSWALPNGKNERYKDNLLKIKGVAGGGSGYVQTKTNGVRFILYLFSIIIKDHNIEDVNNTIKNNCKNDKYGPKDIYPVPDGVKNLLLHMCDSTEYEPIASTADKEKIVNEFTADKEKIVNEFEKIDGINGATIDEKIKTIKKTLGIDNFYLNNLPLLWKGESVNELSRVQLLEYKKAMVLYGPPGTGKTYTAKELAKSILVRHHFKQKTNLKEINSILNNNYEDRIYYLQFHINYNYEDFIAGQTIVGGNVETKKGFIFEVIEKAKEKSEEPFVVILDEINRTDISRVFGELFTAIEKRGEDVKLTLPDPEEQSRRLILNVPDNIYFIGTMNEIDFSLERVDFALRRRFIWELHDYSENALESLINYKIADKIQEAQEITKNLDDYCNACTALNKKVENKMNETYHIGHTFFAEVVDIFMNLSNKSISNPWEKAKSILWQISIKPTLEAYCGTMSNDEKKNVMTEFKNAFFP